MDPIVSGGSMERADDSEAPASLISTMPWSKVKFFIEVSKS